MCLRTVMILLQIFLACIDHILCSRDVDHLVSCCTVDYDFVSSDHKPLFVCFDDLLPTTMPRITNSADSICHFITGWSKSTDHCVTNYQYELDRALSQIMTPSLISGHYTDAGGRLENNALIDACYDDIMRCCL